MVAKTIRRRLITLPGRITKQSRRRVLHLPRNWPWKHDFLTAVNQLRALPPALLNIPALPRTDRPLASQSGAMPPTRPTSPTTAPTNHPSTSSRPRPPQPATPQPAQTAQPRNVQDQNGGFRLKASCGLLGAGVGRVMLYRFVDEQKAEGFPVERICDVAGVSRRRRITTGRQHRDGIRTVGELAERRLVKQIERDPRASRDDTYGSPRVSQRTPEAGGGVVNHKRIERLMRVHNIVGAYPEAAPDHDDSGCGASDPGPGAT